LIKTLPDQPAAFSKFGGGAVALLMVTAMSIVGIKPLMAAIVA
jgi:hypothetical protein